MTSSRRQLLGGAVSVMAGTSALLRAGNARGATRPSADGQAFAVRTADGLTLSARAYGNPANPAIVFVHGLSQSRLSWDGQVVSALAERFRLVTYDMRGHGDSSKPASTAAYGDGALWGDDLAAVIEQTGLRRPTVVGWSLGGMVVAHYLARHGHDGIAGINLVDGVTVFSSDFLTPTSDDFARRLASPDLAVRCSAIPAFLAVCFSRPPAREAFERMLAYNAMPPRELHVGLGGVSMAGLDPGFAKVPRLLLTHGREDALVRVAMSERMLTINPRARLSLYAGAGHAPFYEDMTRFNTELAAFAAPAAAG